MQDKKEKKDIFTKKQNRVFAILCLVGLIGFALATIISLVGGNFTTTSPFAGIFTLINGATFNEELVLQFVSLLLFVAAAIGFFGNLSAFKKED